MIKPSEVDQNEYERLCHIYGKDDLKELKEIYSEPSDDSYNLEEDYARYETEGYYNNYETFDDMYDEIYDDIDNTSEPTEEEDEFNKDEDEWIEEEIVDDRQIDFEDAVYDFDFEEFDRLCYEYDQQHNVEPITMSNKNSKRLTISKDLDIETYCKKRGVFSESLIWN